MEKKLERTPEFEEKVKNQETATFKTPELDMMTQEEFDAVIPATGPAQPEEAEKLRKGTGPATECK
jgi:hypothetical protein